MATEPLDLQVTEAGLRALGHLPRGEAEDLLAALRATRAALQPFVDQPGNIPQSVITRGRAALAQVRDTL